ncbi:hypothetical protein AWN88_22660 [Agrobacterium tumefaciens]|nr:hypothetical protein AWN88_22660 [Agrobacterium tumefaciens]KAJ35072.1 hypothetical protein BW45_00065 [Agrobacterium tumefaciens]
MRDLDIIDILHDAVDAYLPAIAEEERRQRALKFVRGCKAYLATRPPRQKSAEVISFEDHLISSRVQRAVRRTRRSALAVATTYLQHTVNEFGDCDYDCYD